MQQERFEAFLYLLIWKTPLSRDLCIQCLQDRQFVFPAKQTRDLGVASTIHYQMIYWTSFCILFPYLDFALESHPVVSVSDENSVDMAICKILQEIFAKFPKYACSVEIFLTRIWQRRKWKIQSVNCKFEKNACLQINLFEATANRHLISSPRQSSSKICLETICHVPRKSLRSVLKLEGMLFIQQEEGSVKIPT